MSIIRDPNTGDATRVSSTGLLQTFSVTETEYHDFAESGTAFVIYTPTIAIGASGTEGILYFKNTGDGDFHVDSILFSNDVVARWVIYRNPTTGTLISGGTNTTPANLNFGSATTLTSDAKYGTDGSTITDGTAFLTVEAAVGVARFRVDGSIILTKDNSIAIESVVGAAATLSVAIFGHFEAS